MWKPSAPTNPDEVGRCQNVDNESNMWTILEKSGESDGIRNWKNGRAEGWKKPQNLLVRQRVGWCSLRLGIEISLPLPTGLITN